MVLRRRFVVALAAAVVAGIAAIIVSVSGSAAPAQPKVSRVLRPELLLARAAIERLTVPNSVSATLEASCDSLRCIKIHEPLSELSPTLAGLLRDVNANTKPIDAKLHRAHFPFGCFVARLGCSDPGVVDEHLMILSLGPYFPPGVPRTNRAREAYKYTTRHYSEIRISLACGKWNGGSFATDTPSEPCPD